MMRADVQKLSLPQCLQLYLMASYLYYLRDESPISDEEFDLLCKRLLEGFDLFEHQHKYLLDRDSLRAGTGMQYTTDNLPLMVVNAAELFLTQDKL